MSFVLFVYFASIVENLGAAFGVAAFVLYVVSFLFFVFSLISKSDGGEFGYKLCTKFFKICLPIAIIANIGWVFTPTQKTMWLMAGAYYAQELAENPKVQSIGGNVLDVVNLKLEAIEKELKQEAVKGVDDEDAEAK